MKKEELFLRDLMQELPREKAPADITQLIMKQIQPQRQIVVEFPKLKFWETNAFYILLSLCALEGYLLWQNWHYFTFENARNLFREACALIMRNVIVPENYTPIYTAVLCVGLVVWLFVKERIEADRNNFVYFLRMQ